MKDKKINKGVRRIEKLAIIAFVAYLIVGSIFKYTNTHDSSYLILPVIAAFIICWELVYKYLRQGDKK